jgi:hypothetical protein
MRKHNLKLSKKVIEYLSFVRKKYKAKMSVGALFRDFDILTILPREALDYYQGCHFVYKGKHHIFINNKMNLKSGHDLVALHEVAHLLMNKYNFYQQEEAFANGFAFAKAKELGLRPDKRTTLELVKYSERVNKERKKRFRKRIELG